jgi:hypothetical protein
MSIFVGSNDIDDIVIGTAKKESVFIGSNRVWVRPALYNLTVGTSGTLMDGSVSWGFRKFGSSYGSLVYVPNHNAYQSNWFKNLGDVGQGDDIDYLFWNGGGSSSSKVQLTIGSTSTPAFQTPNTDATFSKMTIDGTVFNRADATYSYSSGSNFSSWLWTTSTNPFGTTTGVVKRIRFDKP